MESLIRTLVSTPASSTQPVLSLSQLRSSNYRCNQAPQNVDLASTGHSLAITSQSKVKTASRIEYLLCNQPYIFSEAQTSKSPPAKFVESKPKGKGPRRGPPGVQWNETTSRQYARMYSCSDAHVDDLPIIMKGGGLEFK
jgi:hypothetical protein